MTHEELVTTIANQEQRIAQLESALENLQKLSDENDWYLRELIDALTESVDRIWERGCCCGCNNEQ